MKRLSIRPANAADITSFGHSDKTVRALAFDYDGEVAAIAGVIVSPSGLVAFSDVRAGVTAPKLTFWRCARIIMAFITKSGAPVIAETNPNHPNAGPMLERLGFKYAGNGEYGEIYRWEK